MDAKPPSYTGSDRIVGYVLLCILMLTCTGLGTYGLYTLKHSAPIRIISFGQVGNLKPDDPVYIRGIKIGSVHHIEWLPKQVLVHVTGNRPYTLHEGYIIGDYDIGFMGDRVLTITDGDSTAPCIGSQDTLYGIFHIGISEIIGMSHKMFAAVDSLTALSQRLRSGAPGQASLITQTRSIVQTTDSISVSLSKAFTGLSVVLTPELDSLTHLLSKTTEITHRTASALPAFLATADTGMNKLDQSMQHISDIITRVQCVTMSLENNPLISVSSSDSLRIQEHLSQVTTLLQQLQIRGLQIKIRLHLW
jgi:hypothetical protein